MKITLLTWSNGTQNAFEEGSPNLKSFIKWKQDLLGPSTTYNSQLITKEQYDLFLENMPIDQNKVDNIPY